MSLRLLELSLRVVAWLAPASVRDRWREEWLSEIHCVARERGARTAARLALGAAADAFSLRRLTRERARLRSGEGENGKGPMRLGISSSDFKLALRMLVRFPGLTLVGVFGMPPHRRPAVRRGACAGGSRRAGPDRAAVHRLHPARGSDSAARDGLPVLAHVRALEPSHLLRDCARGLFGGDCRSRAGVKGHRTTGADGPAGSIGRERLADADGKAVDPADRRAGGDCCRGAPGDCLPCVELAAVPHGRQRLRESRVPFHGPRDGAANRCGADARGRASVPNELREPADGDRAAPRSGPWRVEGDVLARGARRRAGRRHRGGGEPSPPRVVSYNIVDGARQGHLVRFNRVATDFFDAFDVPILTGRSFGPGDAGPGATAVVVDRTFVDQLFGGQDALGRRIRYVGRSREAGEGNMVLGHWYEVVGVVNDFPPNAHGGEPPTPRLYHAASPGDAYPVALAVRVRGTATAFSDRLREIGAGVDPALQLRNVSTAEDAMRREQGLMRLIGVTLTAVIGSVVALSAAGIYALMSFTVARRRKEIGIRAALGADPKRILAGVFSRVLGQLAAGALLGLAGAVVLEGLLEGEMFQGHGAVILPAVVLVMAMVGLLAAAGPARRGLRIHPTEALREE